MGHSGPIALQNEAIKLSRYSERVEQWRQQVAMNDLVCADCLARINRDESHTCKQQIKRNKKRA